ncbi:phosphate starvation protein PhoH [Porphyromonas gingivicanis]|uniref:Phosphate starvation protein PhoH n=1 Tax=Porphyromonas gingivicanis TaxID=266762 RepID=A0A0A2GAV1_9PORP|nr:PhoH family protein [Porphyromonas gingivicanis]KGN97589.1 phosphate starvation protein PhoH [Porphyromonas gingivicanis]
MDKKKKGSVKKNFVLDTNVLLHDYECIDKFEENDIYIPITVLEEIDQFKKGGEQINYNARSFVRRLDEYGKQEIFTEGISLGDDMGRLFIKIDGLSHPLVCQAFSERIADHKILSVALSLKDELPSEPVILVTKDVNLRMKAKALGLRAEDYINDKVSTSKLFDKAHEEFEGVDGDLIDRIYSEPHGIDVEELSFHQELEPNECFILKSERNSVMVRYNPFSEKIVKVNKQTLSGITPRNSEQAFAFDVITDPDIKLIGITGKAGTGKTLLALAASLSLSENYRQILMARPIVALANKDLGFLPGDEKQKITPYMQPLFDNLSFIKSLQRRGGSEERKLEELQRDERLVIEALAYIRGRSLSEVLVIVDEAQNLTPHEVKTIITRAGEGTKIIFTGDVEQIDSPYLDAESNGLAYMIDKMKGQKLFAHVNLIKGERSELSEVASNLL